MRAKIENCGSGINSDLTPEEIGPGFWNISQNMRFADGYATRFRGMAQVFNTPAVTPYFLTPYATTTARYWIHAGTNAVYADDGTTRTNITGTAPTGGIDNRWSGGSINGVLILNNGVDNPTYWAGTGTLATIPGWTATWKAAVLRPFKNFIVALNITKSTTNYPHMVKWSTTLNPGSITAAGDWDETNPAKDAGEQDLAETPDLLVDCLPMGDLNIVYKERSMYAMSYVGAPYIFRFQRLPGDVGMLAPGCGVNTPAGHVVLAAGDVIVHNGQGAQSIANAVIRDYIFKNIDSTNYKRSFVTANPQRNEVWVCFPYGVSSTCNTACVWNWVSKTWSIRTLSNVTYGAFGQFNISSTNTWAADTQTWNSDATSWNENEYSPAEARLLMSHSTPLISLADTGTTDFGSLINATLERSGMHMDDPYSMKVCRGIFPRIDGQTGGTITVEIGGSMVADAPPTWSAPVTFRIGVDQKIDSFASGRYLSVRFTNADYSPWRIRSFDIDYVVNGAY